MIPIPPSSSPAVQILVEQGIAAIRQHDLPRAFDMLTNAVRMAPEHEQAWLWLSGAVTDESARKFCLERVLVINPSNTAAIRGLALLNPNTIAVSPLSSSLPTSDPSPPDIVSLPQIVTPPFTPNELIPQPVATQTQVALTPILASPELTQLQPIQSKKPSLGTWSTLGVIIFGTLYAWCWSAIVPNSAFWIVVVVGSSGWVYVDATQNGIQKGMGSGDANRSPSGWFGACIVLWIIAFPLYLMKRSKLIALATAQQNSIVSTLASKQKPAGGSCLATGLFVTLIGFAVLGVLTIQSSPSRSANVPPVNVPPANVPLKNTTETAPVAYKVQEIAVTWTTTARGFTELDGQLWVPEVRATIRNTGDAPTENLYLQAVFYDQDKVIKGDPAIASLHSIPAGFAQGPVFLKGSVGYTSDWALINMGENPQQMWNYELSIGTSYFGPWEMIDKGKVSLPLGYRSTSDPSATAGTTD